MPKPTPSPSPAATPTLEQRPPAAAVETAPPRPPSSPTQQPQPSLPPTQQAEQPAVQSTVQSTAEEVRDAAQAAALPSAAPSREAALVDWTPRAQLPADIAAALPPYCTGEYVEPPLPPESALRSPLITADALTADYQIGKDVTLRGNVVFHYQSSVMSTQQATFEENAQHVNLVGQVVYRQPGVLMQGEDAQIVLEPRSARVDNASFVIHAGRTRGTARRVVQEQDGGMTLTRGLLSRCEPGDNTWSMSTSSVSIDPNRQFATARNAVLRVHDVPIAYIPYLKFPVNDERASGFLFPTVGRSGASGYDATVPYYFNIAPNYDATLTPRLLSTRGLLLEMEARQLTNYMRNTATGAYLPHDRDYDGTRTRQEFKDLHLPGRFRAKDRWLASLVHQGQFGDIDTAIDFTAVSDLDYFVDLGSDLSGVSKTQLNRSAKIGFSEGGFDAHVSGLRVQPLQVQLVTPYQRFPDVSVGYGGSVPGLPLDYSLLTEWVRFDRSTDNLPGIAQLTGNRLHLEPRLTMPFVRPYGHLTTSVAYRYTRYTLQARDPTLERQPTRGIGSLSVDGGLVFDRPSNWFGNAVTQTIEPRLYYLYVGREKQDNLPLFDSNRLAFDFPQLSRENRFSGLDRINDANQLSAALTTRVLDSATGTERVRASVGQIVQFTNQIVNLSGAPGAAARGRSPWAGELAAELSAGFSVRGSWVWAARERVDDSGRVELHYQPAQRYEGDQRVLYAGYSRLGNGIRQTDLAAYWPVTPRVRMIARWYYDIESNRTLDAFGGLELDGCCYRVRVLGRRFLRNALTPISSTPERGIFVQLVLKGLAGFGGNLDKVLENGIPGYRGDDIALH